MKPDLVAVTNASVPALGCPLYLEDYAQDRSGGVDRGPLGQVRP
jgi:hypothetical protein